MLKASVRMDALAHIIFLLISTTWAGPKSQACIEGLLMEAYASAPISVAAAEVGKSHLVFRLDRNGQLILTHAEGRPQFEPLVLPPLPNRLPDERILSIRTLVTAEETIGLFAYTSYERVFRIQITPIGRGNPYIGNWKRIADAVSPLFQPIANETLVEISRDSGTIWVNYRGKQTWIGELRIVPSSFVAFADPSTPDPIALGHKLTIWVVGFEKEVRNRPAQRYLYSWSQAKTAVNGRVRRLSPVSIQTKEVPLSIIAEAAGRRDGVVVKTALVKGQGEKREVHYRLHRHFHGRWSYVGDPQNTPVRPASVSATSLLRGQAAVTKLKKAFDRVEILDPEAMDVARLTLAAEDTDLSDEAFPSLFVSDFDLLAEVFAHPAQQILESIDRLDDLNADPRPFGTRQQHPEAWRQWVALLVINGLQRGVRSGEDVFSIVHRLRDELKAIPGLADGPFWELVQVTLQKMRTEQDYNGSL